MIDLSEMMNAATMRVRKPHLEAIMALGVSWRTIGRLGEHQAPFGVMNGTIADTGLFEPGEGPSHVVQPVIMANAVIDIVAWRTMRPDRWHLITGLGWCMGEDQLCRPAGVPAVLHATPLEWLAEGGQGACILDWSAGELMTLRSLDAIEVPDTGLAKMLRQRLSQPIKLPRINVRRGTAHAA